MPRIKFSKDDLMSARQISAGWYQLQVKSAKEETSKSGDSMNWVIEFQVIGDSSFAGTVIKDWQSEKPMGMSKRIDMIKAISGQSELEEGFDFGELRDLIGSKLEGYCTYDSEFKANKVGDFRPPQ